MKNFIQIIFAAALSLTSAVSFAWQPSGPVHVVIPAPAGSLHDKAFKTIQSEFERQTGVSVIVEYKPGAAGAVGTNAFMKMPADGHHMLVSGSLSHALGEIAAPKVTSWNFRSDFEYASTFAFSTITLVSAKDSKVNSLDRLLSRISAGDTLKYGITFPNQEALIRIIYEKSGADINRAVFVKYNDPAQALVDVVNNSLDVFVGAVPASVPLYRSGKVEFIAVSATAPIEFLPNTPTLASKFKGLTQDTNLIVSLRQGSPAGAAEWWNRAISAAALSESAKTLRAGSFLYLDKNTMSMQQTAKVVSDAHREWAGVYRQIYK